MQDVGVSSHEQTTEGMAKVLDELQRVEYPKT